MKENQNLNSVFCALSGNHRYDPCRNEYSYDESEMTGDKASQKGFSVFLWLLMTVIVFTVGIVIGTVVFTKPSTDKTPTSPTEDMNEFVGTDLDITVNSKPNTETPDNNGKMSISSIYEFVSPSIVEISVYGKSGEGYAIGSYSSGIVMSEDGYIITNDHIYDSIPSPLVYVTVGDEYYKATFVAGDARRDISVLKIDATGLTPAVFGKSSELIIGEDVYAIGNPANLENSITNGIVSALNRRVSNSQGYNEFFIQTNAAISGGSSGGALVNNFGQVIGITSSKYVSTGVEGISFAIPIDEALEMAADLLKNGKVTTRAKMGIKYIEITVADAEINGTPVGLYFDSVSSDSELYKSGIKSGDIITHINGEKITSGNVILDIVSAAKPGDEYTLKVYDPETKKTNEYSAKMLSDEGSTSYNAPTEDGSVQEDGRQPLFPDEDSSSKNEAR